MIVTCESCHTEYQLDPARVKPEGQKLRCAKCHHVWFFTPDGAAAQDQEAHGAMPDESAPHEAPASFHDMVAEESRIADETIPPAVMPAPPDLPVIDHNPGGLSPAAFGACVFFALLFVSLIVLFLARGMIVERAPAMVALYKSIGLAVPVPGEGLKISGFKAHVSQDDGKLYVSATVSNISDAARDYPAVRVTVFGKYGAALKDWELHPPGGKSLAAGEAVPVELNFDKPPADGVRVDMKVIR